MRNGLFFEPRLITPLGELPLSLGFIRRGSPALEILAEHRLGLGIACELGFDVFRFLPSVTMGHLPQQAPGGCVGGVDQGGEHQLLEPFRRQSMRLAPEGELDVGIGIVANLGLGGLISGQVGLGRRLIQAGGRQQATREQHDREHHRLLEVRAAGRSFRKFEFLV